MVNRSDFLPQCCIDDGSPINITPTQPVPTWDITAVMLDALKLAPSDVVLEVGTGSGYQCACWAERCKEVVSLEINPVAGVEEKLPHNVILIKQSVNEFESAEVFDAIVVTCGIPEHIAQKLGAFLKSGGRLVAPVGDPSGQELRKYAKEDGVLEDYGPLAYPRFTWMED